MSHKKICSWPQLKAQLERIRSKGQTIVFTNGCFDLIHVGHLKVLEACKKKGDILVLGLNSDSSVRRLKGPKRPIISQRDRAILLSGFSIIDFITIFNEDTPERLIRMIQPDVLVKGGDWKKESIVGSNVAKKVVRVPLVKGRSTTAIINLIARRYGRS